MANTENTVKLAADRTIALGYRTWAWGEGVAQYALSQAGSILAEPRYTAEVAAFVQTNAAFEPSSLEHVMPSAAALAIYEETGNELGLELVTRVTKMLETHPRSHHGAWTVTPVRSVWVDYIYETAPVLCRLARVTGDRRYQEWAIDQTLAYVTSCWNPRERLFHHVYYDDACAPNPFLWGRANGWTALGLVEMLDLVPAEYGLQPFLSRFLNHVVQRLAELQHESGHWHTVLLDPRTHLEPATTAMISLAVKRGARDGWLDLSLERVADLAWRPVEDSVDAAGNVTGVSAETPPGDADDYQAIERGVYPWGQGFTILAGLDRLQHGA
jgi:unsaturated rhamnogalacturonyl hydrolase